MSFHNVLALIPVNLQNDIIEMDAFIKSLRPLKFKRTVDKRKINYVSPEYGISYAIFFSELTQAFGWYFLHDKANNEWYRKTDYFVEVLSKVAETDPRSAKYIFNAINECKPCKSNPCSAISYAYGGEQKMACYGRVVLSLSQEDFNHAQKFFCQLNAFVDRL